MIIDIYINTYNYYRHTMGYWILFFKFVGEEEERRERRRSSKLFFFYLVSKCFIELAIIYIFNVCVFRIGLLVFFTGID